MFEADDEQPMAKRPMAAVQRPAAGVLKQTNLPNLIVIKQDAAPPKPTAQHGSAGDKKAGAAAQPRILNKTSKVLNASAKHFKSPDLKTNEDGGMELVLEQTDDSSAGVSEVATDVFPCTQCDRTFMLKQLLDMHMVKHNKDRVCKCDYCGNTFFSKYDLAKHMATHSDMKPFTCSVCDKGFTRATLLSRHERLHTDMPHFVCSFCDKTFLIMADLEKHEFNHRKSRPFKCAHCDKSFAFKQGLERHEVKHLADQPFKCEYCDEGFPTATQLARHVTQHAGRRPFPCRLCAKSFLLSHHLTRHIRSHKNVQSSFTCNNCPETFESLNDLLVHSDIHVDDEVSCPLCREELSGPEELNEHMLLHAGEQFACEFCDLIFVEEEQKDEHCNKEHASETAEYENDIIMRKVKKEVLNDEVKREEEDKEVDDDDEDFEIELMSEKVVKPQYPEAPRRGRPPKAKPTILNYMSGNNKATESVGTKPSPSQARKSNVAIGRSDDLLNYEFEFVDVINKDEPKTAQPNQPAAERKSTSTVPARKSGTPSNPDASTLRKISISPTKKVSPIKHVPIAQQKLEQQLQNAMKASPPSKPIEAPKPSSSETKPVLTKVNFKKLPTGVTLKKVVPATRPQTPPTPPKTPIAKLTPTTSSSAPPKSQHTAKPNAQYRPAASANKSQQQPTIKPGMQRVKMTQAQVDAMAKEGKIQMKNGQVFLRSSKTT